MFRGLSKATKRIVYGYLVVDENNNYFILSGEYTTRQGVKLFRKIEIYPKLVSELIYKDNKVSLYTGYKLETIWGTHYVLKKCVAKSYDDSSLLSQPIDEIIKWFQFGEIKIIGDELEDYRQELIRKENNMNLKGFFKL